MEFFGNLKAELVRKKEKNYFVKVAPTEKKNAALGAILSTDNILVLPFSCKAFF